MKAIPKAIPTWIAWDPRRRFGEVVPAIGNSFMKVAWPMNHPCGPMIARMGWLSDEMEWALPGAQKIAFWAKRCVGVY